VNIGIQPESRDFDDWPAVLAAVSYRPPEAWLSAMKRAVWLGSLVLKIESDSCIARVATADLMDWLERMFTPADLEPPYATERPPAPRAPPSFRSPGYQSSAQAAGRAPPN